jgi:hypothetical protein
MSGPSRGLAAFFAKTTMTNAITKAALEYCASDVIDRVLDTGIDQALVVFPELEPIRAQLEALEPCSERINTAQEAAAEATEAFEALRMTITDFIEQL